MAKKAEVIITCDATTVKQVMEGLNREMDKAKQRRQQLQQQQQTSVGLTRAEEKELANLIKYENALNEKQQKLTGDMRKYGEVMKDLAGAKLKDLKKALQDGKNALNNMSATYYWFKDKSLRGEHDIDDLWLLFDAAISYAKKLTSDEKERFVKNFDLMIVKPGIANSKLTMALFWIAPDTYLNLDSRSWWYIYESGRLPQKVVEALPPVTSKIVIS